MNSLDIYENWQLHLEEEDDDDEILLLLLLRRRERRRKRRSTWVTEFRKQRESLGVYRTLLPSLTDVEFKRYLRVTREQFAEIHDIIKVDLEKQYTTFREPISSKERLAVSLRFLASGASFRDLGFHFRLGESTISAIVKEVCESIWSKMQPIYLLEPNEEIWKVKATEFQQIWNFPHCLSAIDGKHVTIRKPLNSGSDYFNYKKSFSVVLLAGVDAKYKFTFVDIGTKGRFSDGFTFANSNFGKKLLSSQLPIPAPAPIETDGPKMPYVFVADAAFPLNINIMRPYLGCQTKSNMQNRIFNYRLSRARQTVECAFGILSARFRIYQRALELQPSTVNSLIKCTCVLHNYLRCKQTYEEEINDIPGENFEESTAQFISLQRPRARGTRAAYDVRDQFKHHFTENDILPWQNGAIQKGNY